MPGNLCEAAKSACFAISSMATLYSDKGRLQIELVNDVTDVYRNQLV